MDGEEGLEEGGAGGEGAESACAEAGMPVEKEQDAGHAPGQGEQGTVAGFVAGEGASGEGVGEEKRLAEGKGKAFSGDGVDGAGGVADEGYVAEGDAGASDTAEAAGEGEATAFGGEGLSVAEEAAEGGEGVQDVGEARVRIARHGGNAEFGAPVMAAGGGDVGLAAGSPVDLDVGGRRDTGGEAEVGAEAEASGA